MKLISLNEFVLKESVNKWSATKRLALIIGYAEFLNKPLHLSMFIPCDEKENILQKPLYYSLFLNNYYLQKPNLINYEICHAYKKEENNVLFKDAVCINEIPHFHTQRKLIDLNRLGSNIRIYTELRYHDGKIEKFHFPNHKNKTIESLVEFNLELTESAINQIFN